MALYIYSLVFALFFLNCQSSASHEQHGSDSTEVTKAAPSQPDNSAQAQDPVIKDIDIVQFMKITTEKPDAVLLDVRTPGEIAEGKIAKALEMDFYADDFRQQIESLDKDDTYLIYCRSGSRSRQTAEMMQKLGFKNLFNLEGGYSAYETYMSEQ